MSATTGGIVEVGTQDILKVHFRDRRLLELGGGEMNSYGTPFVDQQGKA